MSHFVGPTNDYSFVLFNFVLFSNGAFGAPDRRWAHGIMVLMYFPNWVIDRNQYHLFCWAFGLVLIKLVERNDERNSTFR